MSAEKRSKKCKDDDEFKKDVVKDFGKNASEHAITEIVKRLMDWLLSSPSVIVGYLSGKMVIAVMLIVVAVTIVSFKLIDNRYAASGNMEVRQKIEDKNTGVSSDNQSQEILKNDSIVYVDGSSLKKSNESDKLAMSTSEGVSGGKENTGNTGSDMTSTESYCPDSGVFFLHRFVACGMWNGRPYKMNQSQKYSCAFKGDTAPQTLTDWIPVCS
jgi:hypothetical protein